MRRLERTALAAAALAILALAPVRLFAAEGVRPKGAGQYVDITPVGVPVVVDGRLVNYVFVDVRVNLTASADSPKLREREPYFRDALVRLAHRTPFTRYDDFTRVDETRLKAAVFAASVAIAGPGAVRSVDILSQTPQKRSGLPKPKLAGAR